MDMFSVWLKKIRNEFQRQYEILVRKGTKDEKIYRSVNISVQRAEELFNHYDKVRVRKFLNELAMTHSFKKEPCPFQRNINWYLPTQKEFKRMLAIMCDSEPKR